MDFLVVKGSWLIILSSVGHLEEAIQLAKDLFTQSNESANASAIPDLLKQKAS